MDGGRSGSLPCRPRSYWRWLCCRRRRSTNEPARRRRRRNLSTAKSELYATGGEIGALVNRVVSYYNFKDSKDERVAFAERLETAVNAKFGSATLNYSIALTTLAEQYKSNARYAEAEETCKRALAIQESVLGPENPEVISSRAALANLASLYAFTGRYADAVPIYQRIVATKEKTLRPREYRSELFELAGTYMNMGRYADAEQIYLRIVGRRREGRPIEPPAPASPKDEKIKNLFNRLMDYRIIHRAGSALTHKSTSCHEQTSRRSWSARFTLSIRACLRLRHGQDPS
jgi:tetratricopeptide (TPR) repeat protein